MKRRDFFKRAALGAGALIAAPLVAKAVEKDNHGYLYDTETGGVTMVEKEPEAVKGYVVPNSNSYPDLTVKDWVRHMEWLEEGNNKENVNIAMMWLSLRLK